MRYELRRRQITNLVLVLPTLVLDEKLQSLLPDLRLMRPTTAMALLRLFWITTFVILLGFIRLANHLAFAIVPDGSHSALGIAIKSYFIGERGIGLSVAWGV